MAGRCKHILEKLITCLLFKKDLKIKYLKAIEKYILNMCNTNFF